MTDEVDHVALGLRKGVLRQLFWPPAGAIASKAAGRGFRLRQRAEFEGGSTAAKAAGAGAAPAA
jgi:hypothetical protein